jgi:signal transduction histidine kinase
MVNVMGESVNSGGNITLAHNQNVFSIQFTAIDYRNSQNRHLFYMLENYDSDWLQTYAENPANYFKVPPGEYTFRIKAANSSSGIWSEKSFQLTISPPWWATWWAFCIYGLLFIGGVLLTHRYQKARVIRAEREKAQKKELAQAKEIEKAYGRLKTTQTQLIQSEKMASLGELTAGIAHEIQNPLNFVNNFSEVSNELIDEMNEEIEKGDLKEAKAISKDIKQNLEKIHHHGKRADGIVKGMLQHSRSSSGQKEPTDLNVLADEYLRLAYHGLRAKDKSFNATLETHFDESIGKVNVIPQDMGRVILNLITNAFYAVKEKSSEALAKGEDTYEPTVSVITKKLTTPSGAGGIEISVKDNGNGMPEAIKQKIFQPFFTTKPTGQGTGLGLSLSYDIVKAHNGEIFVKSKVGEGTTFTIALPA